MPFPFGALIGAAGSLAGGLIGGNSNARMQSRQIAAQMKINRQNRKLQMKTNKNQIQWLVEDARNAGINPLAALGSTAAGNIGSPSMVAPDLGGLPSSGSAVGDGIARGAALLGSGIDAALVRENLASQNELLNAQSRTLIAQSRAAGSGTQLNMVNPFGDGTVSLKKDPRSSDAQDFEDRYGEIADFVFGPGVLLGDVKKTLGFDPFDPVESGTALARWLRRAGYVKPPAKGQAVGVGRYNYRR